MPGDSEVAVVRVGFPLCRSLALGFASLAPLPLGVLLREPGVFFEVLVVVFEGLGFVLEFILELSPFRSHHRDRGDMSHCLGSVDDGSVVPDLLRQVSGPIERFTADGAYDKTAVCDLLSERGTKIIVPPPKNAQLSKSDAPCTGTKRAIGLSQTSPSRECFLPTQENHRRQT